MKSDICRRLHDRWFGEVPARYWAMLLGLLAGMGAAAAGCWWYWEPIAYPMIGGFVVTLIDPEGRWS